MLVLNSHRSSSQKLDQEGNMVSKMPTSDDMAAPMLPSKHSAESKAPVLSTKRKPGPKLWTGLKEYSRVSMYCLALTSAILLWGYDMAMTGNLYGMDEFKYGLQPPPPTRCSIN